MEKLLFMLPIFQGVFRSMCLEVMHSQADIRPTLYQELKEKGFHDMLQFRYAEVICEFLCVYVHVYVHMCILVVSQQVIYTFVFQG